jgi:hypothetical protein
MATLTLSDGGAYSSLNAASTAASTGDTIRIEGTWAAADTTNCTISVADLTISCDADSKMVGYEAASPTNYRLKPTSGNAVLLNASGTVFDGIEIGSESTGVSDECVRINTSSVTVTAQNSLIYFGSRTDQQDLFYTNNKSGSHVINLTNVIGYNAYRAVVDAYIDQTFTVNINSCHFYNIGNTGSANSRSGVVGYRGGSGTATVNAFNSLFHTAGSYPAFTGSSNTTSTLTIDRCITNYIEFENSGAQWNTVNITNSTVSATWATSGAAGDYVVVANLTAGSEDLRLVDDANNDAQDKHSATSGAGLSMPSTDLLGTTRPQNTVYDVGAFEIVAGGGTTLVMTIGESVAGVDAESAKAGFISTLSESLTSADTSTGKLTAIYTLPESTTILDVEQGRLSGILSVSESAGANDTDEGKYATSQEMIEAVQANDLTTSLFNALLTQSLGAIASDSVSFKTTFGLTVNESVSGTENQGSVANLSLTFNETAAGEDTDSGKASLISTLSESLTGSDNLSFTTPGITLEVGETLVSSDNLSISAHFKMTIGEAANLADSVKSKASLISSIAESISSSDAFNRISVFSLTIGETISATELLSAVDNNLLGQITATITIDPLISGTINLIPTITGTIKVN